MKIVVVNKFVIMKLNTLDRNVASENDIELHFKKPLMHFQKTIVKIKQQHNLLNDSTKSVTENQMAFTYNCASIHNAAVQLFKLSDYINDVFFSIFQIDR